VEFRGGDWEEEVNWRRELNLREAQIAAPVRGRWPPYRLSLEPPEPPPSLRRMTTDPNPSMSDPRPVSAP
jgi:hypothetical protein